MAPRPGRETQALNASIRSLGNGRPNLMLVPTLRHWDVTGWYMTRNSEFGGLTPRQFLRDKD